MSGLRKSTAFLIAAIALVAAAPARGPAISAAALRGHMRFLADDALEGRATATRGYDVAAAYVATQFEAMGLQPAGDGGTYRQRVPLRRGERVPERSELVVVRDGRARALEHGREYLASVDFLREESSLEAPVVFVGFGITAREQGYDDFAGLDVRGRILLRLSGAPASFPATLRAHHSSATVKAATAVAQGALGIVEVKTPEDERRSPWERAVRNASVPAYRWLDERGLPNDTQPSLQATAALSIAGARAVLEGGPHTLEEIFAAAESGRPPHFALPGTLRARVACRLAPAESTNVAAVLPGADPRLAAEHVVYTAHLDHLGIGPPKDGDAVHNGAYDNASGVASLLEMARAFQAARPAPRRSIAFVAVTGEEKGLLGSSFFAAHPTTKGAIVAAINIDMILGLFTPKDVVVLGADHSSLGPVARRAARAEGLAVIPDPVPHEVRFIRSDQYSFVKRGIPSLTVKPGLQSADATQDGQALFTQWMRTVYHTPADDLAQAIDYETIARLARLNWRIGREVADAPRAPRWNPGDFFARPEAAAPQAP